MEFDQQNGASMGYNQEKTSFTQRIHHEDSTIGLLMSFWGLPSPTILNEAELMQQKSIL